MYKGYGMIHLGEYPKYLGIPTRCACYTILSKHLWQLSSDGCPVDVGGYSINGWGGVLPSLCQASFHVLSHSCSVIIYS